jgi:hypothetical protein
MNDLDLIAGLSPDIPLPRLDDLAPARGRLIAAIREPVNTERAAGLPMRPSRRLALTAATATMAAAAAAIGLAFVPVHGQHAVTHAPAASPAANPAAVNLTAARFLEHAAATVGQEPAQPPGPDQFVYIETEEQGGTGVSEAWLSALGNRPGLAGSPGQRLSSVPACTPAQTAKIIAAGITSTDLENPCVQETAGFLPDMPTSPQQLVAYLEQIGVLEEADMRGTSWAANDFGKAVDELLSSTYLLPAQRAALFELMAHVSGFTVVPDAQDAMGRVGVAVKWTYFGAPAEIILNPSTYAYMGDRTWAEPGSTLPGAGAYHGMALVQMAFVNAAGQLP